MTKAEYVETYRRSVEEPEAFWKEEGQRISWMRPYTKVKETSFLGEVPIRWFADGTLNASYNCIDRHLAERGNKPALIWVGNAPGESETITYAELHKRVCRFASMLKRNGVARGDRVTLYMPMIPEAVCAMLACARLGAIHSVVFGGFSPESLANRILDAGSRIVITADEGMRGDKRVPLKHNVDQALQKAQGVERVLVARRTGTPIAWDDARDRWISDELEDCESDCSPEEMGAEDPLFILYTSGSTGKPKGVLHTTGGYLVYAALTHQHAFDLREHDIYWCTADVGWITGHSYMVYGPLANGATVLMYEGLPAYPSPARFWEIVDEWNVSILYTSPTVIRSLMAASDAYVTKTSRKSLRVLGTVGEPINPEAWRWYDEVIGEGRCPIVDTWWQTETGGIAIAPIPGAAPQKPGSASWPFFGIRPAIADEEGIVQENATEGHLVILDSWPGQARTLWGDHQRFIETYFSKVPGAYFTGDGCRVDEDGCWWITGRVDDVINVSGHRLGTAEVESALAGHPAVAESAAVGYPHPIKGSGLFCFVVLREGQQASEELKAGLIRCVRAEIGPIATPDRLHFTKGLPKTRSGKIMRRLLRTLAAGERGFGDISTLVDPTAIDDLAVELGMGVLPDAT
ncbi:MAG TPA: acetate--CoA ligase [Candidatus Paceibacterota bacterium]|nr:acetate--CoA ligase [Candidatus Paceibacterota bacterium]